MDLNKKIEARDSVWSPINAQSSNALMIFNIFFLILGFAVIGFGAMETFGPIGKFVGGSVCAGIIICGSLMVIVSVLGLEATRNRSIMKCSLYYVIILTFVMLGSAVLGIAVLRVDGLGERLDMYWNIMDKETILEVEKHFKCCGFKTINDRPYNPCPNAAQFGTFATTHVVFRRSAVVPRALWTPSTPIVLPTDIFYAHLPHSPSPPTHPPLVPALLPVFDLIASKVYQHRRVSPAIRWLSGMLDLRSVHGGIPRASTSKQIRSNPTSTTPSPPPAPPCPPLPPCFRPIHQ